MKVIDLLDQYVYPFLLACATLLVLLNTQKIYGQNWTEPLESTMRIIITLWRSHITPQEFFTQYYHPLSCSRWRRSRIFYTVNSNRRQSTCSDSFSWCSGSSWDLWYLISSYFWNIRIHLNLWYWRKILLHFHANIHRWFSFELCATFASNCFQKSREIWFFSL